ncbi:MAG TPA: hypothetical protein DDW73_05900 [Rhizobium sp.]|nr:hypothetical protein [Rhizobium sp.]
MANRAGISPGHALHHRCVALLCEAGLRLVLIPLLPVEIFLLVSEVMWLAFFALLMAWSYRYGRR